MSVPNPLVETVGLVRDYGRVRALAGIDLRVMRGEVYGLLGSNGAGKTTTLRILCRLERPTAGAVNVVDHDPVSEPVEVKKKVGYVAESAILYESLTPREYFEFVASTRGLAVGVVPGELFTLTPVVAYTFAYVLPRDHLGFLAILTAAMALEIALGLWTLRNQGRGTRGSNRPYPPAEAP